MLIISEKYIRTPTNVYPIFFSCDKRNKRLTFIIIIEIKKYGKYS